MLGFVGDVALAVDAFRPRHRCRASVLNEMCADEAVRSGDERPHQVTSAMLVGDEVLVDATRPR